MKERKNSQWAYIISILLHLGLLVFLVFQQNRKSKVQEDKPLDIEWVELQDFKKTDPIDKMAQIVQQDDQSINEAVPEKDYKLSKNNQDVLKETRAEKNGEFQNKKNQREGLQSAAQKKAKPKSEKQQQKPMPKVAAKQSLLDRLKPKMFDDDFSNEKLAPEDSPALAGAAISQSDDYLKDVVAGAETHLKTREFVYYSYYSRIKRKLRQHWEPRIKEKIVKILRQGRKIASINDKITRLVITLDESGELVRIQVRSASGYNDLDDAAIEAFRDAAPFPNPPHGIVNATGQVEINWDFVLET